MFLKDEILTLFNEIGFSYHQHDGNRYLFISNKPENDDPKQIIFCIEYYYIQDGNCIRLIVKDQTGVLGVTCLIDEDEIINYFIKTVRYISDIGIDMYLKKIVASHNNVR